LVTLNHPFGSFFSLKPNRKAKNMSDTTLEKLTKIAKFAREAEAIRLAALGMVKTSEVKRERVNAIAALAVILATIQDAEQLFEGLGVAGISYPDLYTKTDDELAQSAGLAERSKSVEDMHICVLCGATTLDEVVEGLDLAFSQQLGQLIAGRHRAEELLPMAKSAK
jgi:hypothetical protein